VSVEQSTLLASDPWFHNSRLGTPLRNAVSLSLRASAPPREPSPVKPNQPRSSPRANGAELFSPCKAPGMARLPPLLIPGLPHHIRLGEASSTQGRIAGRRVQAARPPRTAFEKAPVTTPASHTSKSLSLHAALLANRFVIRGSQSAICISQSAICILHFGVFILQFAICNLHFAILSSPPSKNSAPWPNSAY
jgi:hypothetical protein